MPQNKLIFEGQEYDLIEIQHSSFIVHQTTPYKMLHTVYGQHRADLDLDIMKPYQYKSVLINGKFYAFKPIESGK